MGQLYFLVLLVGILCFTIMTIRSLIHGKSVSPWIFGLCVLTLIYLISTVFRIFV